MANPSSRIYFVNAPVDFLCIGALSLLALGAFALFSNDALNPMAATASLYLSWVVNWPHFSATNYRLFRRPENFRQFPLTAFLVPFLVLGAVIASFQAPQTVAPVFVKLFLLWSPYHFSGQSFGISLLYARRAGFDFESWERRALSFFIFSTFLVPTFAAEVGMAQREYYGIEYVPWNIPPVFAQLAWFLLYGSAAVFAFAAIRRLALRKSFFPAITLLPAVTQFSWFVVGWRVPAFYYFVPFFHSLQYLLIAWTLQMTERQAETQCKTTGFKWRESAYWAGVNLVGGAILFFGLPKLAEAQGIALPLATGVLIAGVQVHHFLVDGVIWKLRKPSAAKALVEMRKAA